MPSAKQLIDQAARDGDWDTVALFTVGACLEYMDELNAHQPVSVLDRGRQLVAAISDASTPQPAPATIPTSG